MAAECSGRLGSQKSRMLVARLNETFVSPSILATYNEAYYAGAKERNFESSIGAAARKAMERYVETRDIKALELCSFRNIVFYLDDGVTSSRLLVAAADFQMSMEDLERHKTAGLTGLRLAEKYLEERPAPAPKRRVSFSTQATVKVSGAEVSGAEVSGAEVSGAEVSGAEVSGAEVSGDVPDLE